MRTCQQHLEAKLGYARKAGLLWLDRLFLYLLYHGVVRNNRFSLTAIRS